MDEFEAEIRRLARAADEELARTLRRCVERATEAAAQTAKTSRRYKDRTGALTASIEGRLTASAPLAAEGVYEATAAHAEVVEFGSRAHEIRPRQARAIAFEGQNGMVFARRVQHPGTQPDGFFQRGAKAAEKAMDREAEEGIERIRRILES